MIRPLVATALLAACCAAGAQVGERAPFALLGDAPYSQAHANLLDTMIDEINTAKPAFVVHLGDITSRDCSDAWFEARQKQFARFTAPFVLVVGDNEWSDCHLAGFDPMERLAKIRNLFHSQTVGLPGFARQSDNYPEHVRWTHSRALFVGINVPGSNNNLGRTPEMDAEHATRMKAVVAWLDEAAAMAKSSGEIETLVVLMQANPDFELRRKSSRKDGYASLREKLAQIAGSLGKPLVVAHGDTHIYKFDRPSKAAPSLVRIEVDGWPWLGWVKVRTTPEAATPVMVERLLNQ
jgi:hypothetical protein